MWSTLAGGGLYVLVARELNWSTQEDLEGLIQVSEEEVKAAVPAR